MNTTTRHTSAQDQKLASRALPQIRNAGNKLRSKRTRGIKISLGEAGEQVTIPESAYAILLDALTNISEGRTVTILPSETELSTIEAAEILHISRPHLIKLMNEGKLPFHKVGTHRRILLQDLITYKQGLAKIREKQLAFLATQSQDLNLGYE